MTDLNVDLNNRRRLICQCLCPCSIDRTLNDVRDENVYYSEEDKEAEEEEEEGIFLTSKAKALSNLLFLKDDIFELETLNLYNKKAITIQLWNSEHHLNNRYWEEFQSQPQVIKRYLQNEAKQMNRYALITMLSNVSGPIVQI
ncbi:unnamed protein product [Schistosoma rodhaini]|uniref:Uncharacterized protein n=1 Tax=Schistosoma rodhaini TaxID=6188 RepID=A0AA85FD17_9TREM|nr:unnamed protein product [Schistosoma rodhaini]CAH8531619.1 unnamed protein product [Schistosoma rodhaini]